MKLFLDTNVLIDYLAACEPFCHDIREIVCKSQINGILLVASSITFTTMEYVRKKKVPHDVLMNQFALLRKIIHVPATDGKTVAPSNSIYISRL